MASAPNYTKMNKTPPADLKKEDVGYPQKVANTQTIVTRGSGAATRGNKFSKNSQ